MWNEKWWMRNFFTLWWMYKKKRLTRWVNLSFSVVSRGFEPRQTEPKPVVLPLHHETIICFIFQKRCKVTTFYCNYQIFLQLFLKFFISCCFVVYCGVYFLCFWGGYSTLYHYFIAFLKCWLGYFWSVLNESRWIVTQIAIKISNIFNQIGSTMYTESRIVAHRVVMEAIFARRGMALWIR